MKGSWVSFRLWRTHRFAATTGSLKCKIQGFSPNLRRKVKNDPHDFMRILYTLSQRCPIMSSKSVKILRMVDQGSLWRPGKEKSTSRSKRQNAGPALTRLQVPAFRKRVTRRKSRRFSDWGWSGHPEPTHINLLNKTSQAESLAALKGNLKKHWGADRNLSFYSKSYHISKWDCTNRRFQFADNGGSY